MTALGFTTADLSDGARFTRLCGVEEWLHRPTGVRTITDFTGASLGGWDEMLPTIDACRIVRGGVVEEWGDHGDVWNRRWSGECDAHEVEVGGLKLGRTVVEESTGVLLEYTLRSIDGERPVQWAAHPQFSWVPGTTVELGVASPWRRVHPDAETRVIGGDVDPWSLLGSSSGAKWWSTHPIDRITMRRPSGTALRISWDAAVLPCVALWIDPAAYASAPVLAIEPALAPHDSLADAIDDGSAPIVGSEQPLRWWLRLEEIG